MEAPWEWSSKEVGEPLWWNLILRGLMTQPFLCSFRSCCSLAGRRGSTTGAWGGPGAGAGLSSCGNQPLPAGTHLILGGGVPGNHAAKIVGVHAVDIPRVEFDGGHAFNLQGNRGGRERCTDCNSQC